MSLLDLPNELLLMIASDENMHPERDIRALVFTNRRLYYLLDDSIYHRNIRVNGSSALYWGARFGREIIVRKCLGYINKSEPPVELLEKVLLSAVYGGNKVVVQLLLEALGNTKRITAFRLLLDETPRNMILKARDEWEGTPIALSLALLHQRASSNSNDSPRSLMLLDPRSRWFRDMSVFEKMKGTIVDGPQAPKFNTDLGYISGWFYNYIHITPNNIGDSIKGLMSIPRDVKLLVLNDETLDLQFVERCRRLRELLPEDVQVIIYTQELSDEVMQSAKYFAPDMIPCGFD